MKNRYIQNIFIGVCAGLFFSAIAEGTLLPPMNGQPTDFAPRRAGAEVGAFIKITVTNEGLYRLDQPALVAAGVEPLDLVGTQLRLYCTTQEVGVFVSNGGLWTAADYLVFFGKPFEGEYSEANVYWLGIGGSGKRMASRSAAPIEAVPDTVSCAWRTRYRNYSILQDKYLTEDDSFDHWFINVFQENVATLVPLKSDKVIASEPARLNIVLYGHSSAGKINPDHVTKLKMNGQQIAKIKFDGQSVKTASIVFPATMLTSANTLWGKQILRKGLTVDRVYLKELSLDYTRQLSAIGDALVFPGKPGVNNYKVQRFSAAGSFWVLDVTDPDSPVLLTDSVVSPKKGKYFLRFGANSSEAQRYAVCQPLRVRVPAKVEVVDFTGLGDTGNQVDYLVICPPTFQAQADRLVARRADQGLSGLVVPLPDIYNEFSYGIADAGAIKQFLGYAFHHWQGPPPKYVLLAGTGSYDPKGYLIDLRGKKAFLRDERIPLHMGPSLLGWASMDGWFSQVNGADKVVDMALGRLPAKTPGMLRDMIDKIIASESIPKASWRRKEALLVADWTDASLNGKAACETIRKQILSPAGFLCTTGYTVDLNEPTVHQIVLDSFHAGVFYACYFGHGAMNLWGHHILNTIDAASFQNKIFPVVLMVACRNGALQNPVDGPCMMEALMSGKARGASACFGTTAISFGPSSTAFTQGVLRENVKYQAPRLGDGFLEGIAALYTYNPSTQELLYMNLFGDPAMIVSPP